MTLYGSELMKVIRFYDICLIIALHLHYKMTRPTDHYMNKGHLAFERHLNTSWNIMIKGIGSVERWVDKLSIPVDTTGKAMHLVGHKTATLSPDHTTS